MDLGRVSEEDNSGESSPVLENREDDVNEEVTATVKFGKVRCSLNIWLFVSLNVEKMMWRT